MPRAFIFALLRVTFIHVLVRTFFQRRRVTVLLYHAVRPDILDRHLAVLKKNYTFITLRDYLDAREFARELPLKPLVLTLDDGHASNRALLPILKKHDVRATIFLCSGIVGTQRRFWFKHPEARLEVSRLKNLPDTERLERLRNLGFEETRVYSDRQALTWKEVDDLREFVDFQPHSVFHPILPRCDEKRARDEIANSKEHLEARGFVADVFAYPNGDYSDREKTLVRESGYKCALSIDPGFNTQSSDLFALRRIGIPDDGGTSEVLVRASGLWGFLRVLLKGRYQSYDPD